MLQRVATYFNSVPAIFLDGTLYFFLAVFQFLQIQFASDEAGKYISLQSLFWLKTIVGATAAGLLAIKLFRSTTYAEHQRQQKADETGEVQVVKPTDASIVERWGNTEFLRREALRKSLPSGQFEETIKPIS